MNDLSPGALTSPTGSLNFATRRDSFKGQTKAAEQPLWGQVTSL
jgi:hypothetical protein